MKKISNLVLILLFVVGLGSVSAQTTTKDTSKSFRCDAGFIWNMSSIFKETRENVVIVSPCSTFEYGMKKAYLSAGIKILLMLQNHAAHIELCVTNNRILGVISAPLNEKRKGTATGARLGYDWAKMVPRIGWQVSILSLCDIFVDGPVTHPICGVTLSVPLMYNYYEFGRRKKT